MAFERDLRTQSKTLMSWQYSRKMKNQNTFTAMNIKSKLNSWNQISIGPFCYVYEQMPMGRWFRCFWPIFEPWLTTSITSAQTSMRWSHWFDLAKVASDPSRTLCSAIRTGPIGMMNQRGRWKSWCEITAFLWSAWGIIWSSTHVRRWRTGCDGTYSTLWRKRRWIPTRKMSGMEW